MSPRDGRRRILAAGQIGGATRTIITTSRVRVFAHLVDWARQHTSDGLSVSVHPHLPGGSLLAADDYLPRFLNGAERMTLSDDPHPGTGALVEALH
ncbi:hypothetical protein [Corynebacterium sp. AOP12-C2-36]|uniref:hypothetical protein n=1 Tax=Corynebacterium sp. AOP12-C2-36 TaxID=3457723 RepID=UPI004033FF43